MSEDREGRFNLVNNAFPERVCPRTRRSARAILTDGNDELAELQILRNMCEVKDIPGHQQTLGRVVVDCCDGYGMTMETPVQLG